MKAILCEHFGMPDQLKFKDVPNPEPLENQVLIEVKACGVNFPDLLIVQNKYQIKPELPFSPGGEVAGKVIGMGKKVTHLNIGDSVLALCGWGGFAEQIAVNQDRVFKIPAALDPKFAAATLYNFGTSYHALKDRANIQKGETLLVLGASGGIGLAAVELGKIMGAKVIAAASTSEKLELCQDRGADLLINYEEEDLKSRIKELTDGKGVDVILDPVGGEFTDAAIRGMAWKGRYLIVGFASGDIPKIPMNLPLLKGCEIAGVFWGQFSKIEPDKNAANLDQLTQWLIEGKIKGPIVKEYPLKDAKGALMDLQERDHIHKSVIIVS